MVIGDRQRAIWAADLAAVRTDEVRPSGVPALDSALDRFADHDSVPAPACLVAGHEPHPPEQGLLGGA